MAQTMNTNLNGELLTNAINFLTYMDETNGYEHLNIPICFIDCDPDALYIFFQRESVVYKTDINLSLINDELKEFAWSKINRCNHFKTNGEVCGCGEQPGHSFVVIGKKFDNLCNCAICITNPSTEEFDKAKELIEACKHCIDEEKKGAQK